VAEYKMQETKMNKMKITVAVTVLCLVSFFSMNAFAGDGDVKNIKPEITGKTFLFDYGAYAYDITVTSEDSLHWKLVKGSFEGPASGSNPYLASKLSDGIIFLSWKEESGMQFYNVMDLTTGKLTTHANADGLSVNMGTVSLKK
jgi:hypothetical protein